MINYAIKTVLSALVLVAVAEIAKRNSIFAALVASLPLTSLLAFVWLYHDTGDTHKVAALSYDIFWMVLPSLALFLLLPLMIKAGWGFWLSFGLSIAATAACYGLALTAYRSWAGQT